MTVLRDGRVSVSGSVLESPATGVFGYGVPVSGDPRRDGSLAVTGGAQHALTGAGGQGPVVSVGHGQGYAGAVVVADAGSRLALQPAVGSSAGADLRIGRAGGDGAVYVVSGAAVQLGPPGPGAGAAQTLSIGRDPGSRGLADILGGTLGVAGATVTLEIGRLGGGGRLRVLEDGLLQLTGGGAGPVTVQIGAGRGGGRAGDGQLLIDGARALVQAGPDGPARLQIGVEGGIGALDLDGPGPVGPWTGRPVAAGLVVNGGAGGAPVTAEIGRGGDGTLRVDGALFALTNRGDAVDARLVATPVAGRAGGDVALTLGTAAGTGRIEADGGARLLLAAGGRGTARLEVGTGGEGVLRLASQSVLQLEAGGEARLLVGAGGQLLLAGGAQLTGADRLAAEGGLIRLAGGGRLSLSAELRLSDGARLGLEGGVATAPKIGFEAGTVLAGSGTLGGPAPARPAQVTLNAATLRIGDTFDPAAGPGAALRPGIGTLHVDGDVAKTGGRALFDLGAPGADLLEVAGRLTLTGTQIGLGGQGGGPAPQGVLLARAAGGIALSGAGAPEGMALQLRAGGTELWAVPQGGGLGDAAGVDGRIATRGGAAVDGATVTFTPSSGPALETVAASGAFSLSLAADAAGRIDAALDAAGARPTTAGALAALRLAVGLPPGWGPAQPADFIAADINGDGRVGTDDALDILRLAVGLRAAHALRWVFVDAADDLASVGRGKVIYETGLWFDAATDASPALTAILVGDPAALG